MYVEYEHICDLIHQDGIYNIYKKDGFYDNIDLSLYNGDLYEIQRSNYQTYTIESVVHNFNWFDTEYRNDIAKRIEKEEPYNIIINLDRHEIVLDLNQTFAYVVIFDVRNATHNIDLDIRGSNDVKITQTSRGVEFKHTPIGGEKAGQPQIDTYPGHVFAYFTYWENPTFSLSWNDEPLILIGTPYKRCYRIPEAQ